MASTSRGRKANPAGATEDEGTTESGALLARFLRLARSDYRQRIGTRPAAIRGRPARQDRSPPAPGCVRKRGFAAPVPASVSRDLNIEDLGEDGPRLENVHGKRPSQRSPLHGWRIAPSPPARST